MKKQWLVISSMVVIVAILLTACRNQPTVKDTSQSVTTSVLVGTSSGKNTSSHDSSVFEEASDKVEISKASNTKVSILNTKSSVKSNLSTKSNTQTSKTSTSRQSRVQSSDNSTKPSSSKMPSRFDTNEVQDIAVESEICIAVGEIRQVVAFVIPANAEGKGEVKTEISDLKIIEVVQQPLHFDGIMYVKGKAVGECTITFIAPNGVKDQTKVIVTEQTES